MGFLRLFCSTTIFLRLSQIRGDILACLGEVIVYDKKNFLPFVASHIRSVLLWNYDINLFYSKIYSDAVFSLFILSVI